MSVGTTGCRFNQNHIKGFPSGPSCQLRHLLIDQSLASAHAMLRNIATIVIVALLALIQVSASPVPGGDHKPDKYRTGKHQCKGGQIFNKELHKCLCLDRSVWDDYKCECICPEWWVLASKPVNRMCAHCGYTTGSLSRMANACLGALKARSGTKSQRNASAPIPGHLQAQTYP